MSTAPIWEPIILYSGKSYKYKKHDWFALIIIIIYYYYYYYYFYSQGGSRQPWDP